MNAQMPIGVVHDMPFADYMAIDAVSASGLRVFARSPWHYRNRIEQPPTRPMLCGTLAHCAVLEPDAMDSRYVVVPSDAPSRPSRRQWEAKNPSPASVEAMAWWRAFEDRAAGRTIIRAEEFDICAMQLEAVARDADLTALLKSGRGEVSLFWIDSETGLYCKARPDWIADDGPALDLKTCADESPNGFGRAAARLRYDLQAAHYSDGLMMTTGRPHRFIFGAVTNKPPVLAVPYELTDEIMEQAREDRRELMDRMAWCMRNNEWPAYGSGVQLLDFPAYAKRSGEIEVEWEDAQ